jgi:hypothetical protein
MDKRVYVLQKDYLVVNTGSGITYGKGIEVKLLADTTLYYSFPGGELIWHKMVENNPEWFKLKEQPKEWEIYAYKKEDRVITCGSYEWDLTKHLFALGTKGIEINRVCRLSDGEVFAISDYSNFGIIKGFEIDFEKKLRVLYDKIGDWQYINSISHPPKEQPVQDTFQWDDTNWEGIAIRLSGTKDHKEAARYLMNQMNIILNSKQSKSTPKEDKVEVTQFAPYTNNRPDSAFYSVGVSKEIPPEKYPSIKKAIENILNGKEAVWMDNYHEWVIEQDEHTLSGFDTINFRGKDYINKNDVEMWLRNYSKKHTEKELLEAEEKAFYASRETKVFLEKDYCRKKYDTFSDYKNQK